jgi:hypothetical protein
MFFSTWSQPMPEELKRILQRSHATIEQLERAAEQARKLAEEARRIMGKPETARPEELRENSPGQ